jgi:hypothetical protein
MEPSLIIIIDTGDGFIKAQLAEVKENADEEQIPVYKQVEYYHSLESALNDC